MVISKNGEAPRHARVTYCKHTTEVQLMLNYMQKTILLFSFTEKENGWGVSVNGIFQLWLLSFILPSMQH
ncbi:hypothetical protein Sjap_007425 [Stephania japonica]|uniref:Uncharacterized protein n=1 Tax=Stephania japonica TaxID=461633 RepID=A0AAP0JNI8_9MAGN